LTNSSVSTATDVLEKIQKFKEEKIGSRRKDFVETVKIESTGNADGEAMDFSG
jgi:hypothetical protein